MLLCTNFFFPVFENQGCLKRFANFLAPLFLKLRWSLFTSTVKKTLLRVEVRNQGRAWPVSFHPMTEELTEGSLQVEHRRHWGEKGAASALQRSGGAGNPGTLQAALASSASKANLASIPQGDLKTRDFTVRDPEKREHDDSFYATPEMVVTKRGSVYLFNQSFYYYVLDSII